MNDDLRSAGLSRPVPDVPGYIRLLSRSGGLTDAYSCGPPYQRNDYIGWITKAKLESTRQKRLRQKLDKLDGGDVYMNMDLAPTRVLI